MLPCCYCTCLFAWPSMKALVSCKHGSHKERFFWKFRQGRKAQGRKGGGPYLFALRLMTPANQASTLRTILERPVCGVPVSSRLGVISWTNEAAKVSVVILVLASLAGLAGLAGSTHNSPRIKERKLPKWQMQSDAFWVISPGSGKPPQHATTWPQPCQTPRVHRSTG